MIFSFVCFRFCFGVEAFCLREVGYFRVVVWEGGRTVMAVFIRRFRISRRRVFLESLEGAAFFVGIVGVFGRGYRF